MVRRVFARFVGETSGVTLVEGLLVFPLMVLVISVCIEFGYAMYQINMAAKAMELGVRRLIVSEPFSTDFATVFAFDPAQGGNKIDADATVKSVCGAGATPCIASAMDWLVGPNGPSNSWPGLASYYPSVDVQNIRITYEQNGLGYQGRPTGPVVSVRMELVNQSFNLPLLGALLRVVNFNLPPMTVSTTSEDLQSPTCCSWPT
jgi:hypothetical protein